LPTHTGEDFVALLSNKKRNFAYFITEKVTENNTKKFFEESIIYPSPQKKLDKTDIIE
jgi:hypothetical protein